MHTAHRVAFCFAAGALALGTAGCLPSIEDLDQGPLTETFAVSDVFTPSGFMGDGQHFGLLVGYTNERCKPRAGMGRGNCYAFTYYPNNVDEDPWAGVYWVFPANSWGSTYGHAIDSTKFKRVSFYAAIEGPTPWTVGGQPQKFNGLAGRINPNGFYSDPMRAHPGPDYQDAIDAYVGVDVNTGVNDINANMQKYQIALTDFNKGIGCVLPPTAEQLADPKFIPQKENCMEVDDPATPGAKIRVANDLIGAFAWSVHYPTDHTQCKPPPDASMPADWCHNDRHSSQFINPPPVTIYLDDIVWETE